MAYLQRASSPLLRVRLKSKKGEPHYDSTAYFRNKYQKYDVLKLEKVGEKHLKIVSVNDELVINQALVLDEAEREHVKNSCFISVRPDWTDSTPLFGHYNFIDQRYHLTPALNFILSAKEHPEIPFFLILDEMNLAKVEHYFSDFLSCIESRHVDGENLTQEPIQIHSDSEWLSTNNSYFDLIGPTLELPPNLYVTGTVNIDESTYMFSSKVLDRANVIELNDVDINAYGSGKDSANASTFVLQNFPNLSKFELPKKTDFQSIPKEARSFLSSVHAILENHHLHFGYRVINEVSRYILNAQTYCEPHSDLMDQALDRQLVQKILPKFNGPQTKLDAPIRALLTLISTGFAGEAMAFEDVEKLDVNGTRYPLSAAKLQRMSKALSLNGFANFVE
jgi:5-methylcytosine-specific restriction endonuclease McrBC GTP-binding regulatory subunit McrB